MKHIMPIDLQTEQEIKMKTMLLSQLVAFVVFVNGIVGHPTSNCTAEYMDDLLRQALHIKEHCDLKGRFDCCKAQTLSKLALLHTPQTGVYETTNPCAHSDESSPLIQTRCDMETDGGGWTGILRRRHGPRTDFNRGWDDYENGFGDPHHEYWLGLKNIHCLTLRDNVDLMIDLQYTDGNGITWIYNHFKVAGSDDNYRIDIGGAVGPPDGYDAMAALNGSQFTTRDSDHDQHDSTNCAQHPTLGGGWWHTNCKFAQLTGPRPGGIYWFTGIGNLFTVGSSAYRYYANVDMKIRPKSCKTECP